jgi:uncharacterized protein YlbG (UPF0298 family)
MNSKQIYQKYLEVFWDTIQKENLIMFVSPQDHNKIILCNKPDCETICKELTPSNRVYSEPMTFTEFEELTNFCVNTESTTLKKSISNRIIHGYAGQSLYTLNDSTVVFNEKVILNLLANVERKDDKLVFDNLSNFLLQYCDHSKIYWNLIHSVKEKYGMEKSIEFFYSIPRDIGKFGQHADLKAQIISNLSKIKNLFGKDYHKFVLDFVTKRANQANVSQFGSINLREALITFYSGDPVFLEDYQEIVPSVKKYLAQTEDGDFFLQKKPEIISRVIDLEELKAVASISMSSNDQYLALIRTFLNWYKAKDKRIIKSEASVTWVTRKHSYLSLFVNTNPDNPVSEDEFDIKLKSFIKMVSKANPTFPNDIHPFMDKWWDADELAKQLDNKSENKPKKMKI